jgi:hypothetical protein
MTATLEIVEANLPDPHPIGWRHYVAILGHKRVTLIMLATGERVQLPLDVYRRCSRPLPAKLARMDRAAKRLRRNAKDFGNQFEYVKEVLSRMT